MQRPFPLPPLQSPQSARVSPVSAQNSASNSPFSGRFAEIWKDSMKCGSRRGLCSTDTSI